MNFITRFRRKLRWRSQYDFQTLNEEVKRIGTKHTKLVICPDNTGSNWLGIKNATLSMFPEQTLVIPQEYSNQVVSDHDLKTLVQTFKNLNGKSITFSGFPSYFDRIINFCSESKLDVEFIFHGGLAELNQNPNRQEQMNHIFKLSQSGEISQIYVVKDGLDKLFSEITKTNTKRLTPPTSIPENLKIKKFTDGKIHIGIFGNNSFNKNRHTQVAAAVLIPNSVIHIIGENEFSYLIPETRVISHNQLNRREFLELLGSMNINLYCSFTESWGQITLESLSLGVPCISGVSSGLQELVKPKFKKCFITNIDNPVEIANQIQLFI